MYFNMGFKTSNIPINKKNIRREDILHNTDGTGCFLA